MGSYSYIYLSNNPCVEDDYTINDETDEAVEGKDTENDQEYEPVFLKGFEAKYCVPLFWLMLFEAEHCKSYIDEVEDEDEDEEGESVYSEVNIPYLSAPLKRALDNASRRRHILTKLFTPEQLELFDYWTAKLAEESALYIEVELENLVSMLPPEDLDAFKDEVIAVLAYLEEATPEDLLSNHALINLAGLNGQNSPESGPAPAFALCGYSFDLNWPEEELSNTGKASRDTLQEKSASSPPKPTGSMQKEQEQPQGLLKRLWQFLVGR